jgi:hypothetical protein
MGLLSFAILATAFEVRLPVRNFFVTYSDVLSWVAPAIITRNSLVSCTGYAGIKGALVVTPIATTTTTWPGTMSTQDFISSALYR